MGAGAAWRMQEGLGCLLCVYPNIHAVGSGTWGFGDGTPGMKA